MVVAEENSSNSAEGSPSTKAAVVDDADQPDNPSQDKTRAEISKFKVHIASLVQLRNTDMSTVTVQQIKDKEKQLSSEHQWLRR